MKNVKHGNSSVNNVRRHAWTSYVFDIRIQAATIINRCPINTNIRHILRRSVYGGQIFICKKKHDT